MIASYMRALRSYGRDVRFILLVSALMGFTIDGGIYPVVFNLYMLRMGFGTEFIGLVNSAGLLVFALASLPAGALGGRFGPKRMMLVGILLCLLGSATLPMADLLRAEWQRGWIFTSYIILYLGVAFYYVNCSPVLISSTPGKERTRVIAVQSAMIGVFAFAGGMIAGFLPGILSTDFGWQVNSPAPYRIPLIISALALIPAVMLIARTGPILAHIDTHEGDEKGAPAAGASFAGAIIAMSVIRFLQVAGVGSMVTFFNVYMDEALGAPTSLIGTLSAVSRLLAVPAALATPYITRRLGNGATAVWVSFLVVIFMLPLALVPSWQGAGLSYVAVLACTSIRYPAFFVYIMEITPSQLRPTMSGAGEMSAGLSFALIALVGGYIIAGYSYSALFLFAAGMTAVGTTMFWAYLRREQRIREMSHGSNPV
jgi:MFS family permease